jgi:uncharacterized membrane protein YhfC
MTSSAIDPAIAAALGLAGLVCIAGPFLLAIWWRRRTAAPMRAFFYGALIFVVFQLVLRLPWQIPLAVWARAHPGVWLPVAVFSALTAGLFEEIGRWVGYRTLLRGDHSMRTGVMYGLGHGGIESVLVVGTNLIGLMIVWILVLHGEIADARVVDAVRAQIASLDLWTMLLTVVERASTLAIHVGLSLIVLQVFVRRQWRWLAIAVAIHAVVDFTAVFLVHGAQLAAWLVEVVIAAAAAAILYLGLQLARRAESAETIAAPG